MRHRCTSCSRPEYLLDGRAERLGTIDDEQVFAVGWQASLAQASEQLLDGCRILRCPGSHPQNVFVPLDNDAHSADDVVFAEALWERFIADVTGVDSELADFVCNARRAAA